MPSQDTQKQSKEDTLFEVVYQLAKEKNEAQLTEMVKKGYCLSVFRGEYSPVMLLAKERDSESVEFLINKFKASRNHAVHGYAIGRYVEEVNDQIAHGANRDYAVHGYAMGGHVEEVNDQIAHGASRNYAVYGYARGGHVKEVNDQIAHGASRNSAVYGYAFGGHVKEVNDQIAHGASRDDAVQGYAFGGHVKEVNDQIAHGASRNHAVTGYAMGGHVEEVNDQIAHGASRNHAVRGYAAGGHVEEVNDQIAHGASRDDAVFGYAMGGHVEEVNDQIAHGASRNHAVRGYACGGNVEEVNDQIAHGANRNSAVQGYAAGGHVKEGNILRLMAFTGDEELRKSLAEEAKKKSDSLDVSALQIKAAKLNKIMKEHQLNFQESQSLTVTGARVWLLQGPQFIRDQKINSDIFWEITSRVLGGLSLHETKHVFASAHNHLFRGMKGHFTTGFFSFFRSQQETEKLVHEVEQKYQKRIKF